MKPNLIDSSVIDRYLDEKLAGLPDVQRLLKLALTKPLTRRLENLKQVDELPADAPDWLRRRWSSGDTFHSFSPDSDLDDKVRHVADWLQVAVQDGEEWIKKLSHGRPTRFTSINTLEDALVMADADMRARNKRLAKQIVLNTDGEEQVLSLSGGFQIVKLTTAEALDREGVAMGHCIGQGSYDQPLAKGSREFFSLRDAKNEPHATIEVDIARHAVLQCQGKENKPPVARYLPHLQKFLGDRRYKLLASASLSGLVEHEGNYYSIANMPDGMKFNGNLDLSYTSITSLPSGLEVSGNLFLTKTPLASLPEGLKVGGHLYVKDTVVKSLPEGLDVGGTLNASNTLITGLPNRLSVGKDLILENTRITDLRAGLKVKGSLYLTNSPIKTLPRGLEVSQHLFVTGTGIRQIPTDAKIGGRIIGLDSMVSRYGKLTDSSTRER